MSVFETSTAIFLVTISMTIILLTHGKTAATCIDDCNRPCDQTHAQCLSLENTQESCDKYLTACHNECDWVCDYVEKCGARCQPALDECLAQNPNSQDRQESCHFAFNVCDDTCQANYLDRTAEDAENQELGNNGNE